MSTYNLDEIDRGILHCLQEDARTITTEEMGERVGVAASTVRNRIENMEQAGIIRGYHPEIDYAKAGYDLHLLFICGAEPTERSRLAEGALGVSGVVEVSEIVDGGDNVLIEAIATDANHMAEIHDSIAMSGLNIKRTEVFRKRLVQPFNHFMGAADDTDSEEL